MERLPVKLFATFVTAVALTVACSSVPKRTTDEVDIRDLPKLARDLDGKRVSTYGLVSVKWSDLNVVSQKDPEGSTCIGLLIGQDKFETLRKYDGKWLRVTGVLQAQGCGGENFCHDSCGPVAIRDPELSPR
jgi:hypothetical protein